MFGLGVASPRPHSPLETQSHSSPAQPTAQPAQPPLHPHPHLHPIDTSQFSVSTITVTTNCIYTNDEPTYNGLWVTFFTPAIRSLATKWITMHLPTFCTLTSTTLRCSPKKPSQISPLCSVTPRAPRAPFFPPGKPLPLGGLQFALEPTMAMAASATIAKNASAVACGKHNVQMQTCRNGDRMACNYFNILAYYMDIDDPALEQCFTEPWDVSMPNTNGSPTSRCTSNASPTHEATAAPKMQTPVNAFARSAPHLTQTTTYTLPLLARALHQGNQPTPSWREESATCTLLPVGSCNYIYNLANPIGSYAFAFFWNQLLKERYSAASQPILIHFLLSRALQFKQQQHPLPQRLWFIRGLLLPPLLLQGKGAKIHPQLKGPIAAPWRARAPAVASATPALSTITTTPLASPKYTVYYTDMADVDVDVDMHVAGERIREHPKSLHGLPVAVNGLILQLLSRKCPRALSCNREY
ncbi:hypothetical protein BDZ91DRAFT_764203 [Kalaharituber pfeilii]|nr:hypothetical protein BDZ91DRAFT_764203 [Kalaharituber pfeilii]